MAMVQVAELEIIGSKKELSLERKGASMTAVTETEQQVHVGQAPVCNANLQLGTRHVLP